MREAFERIGLFARSGPTQRDVAPSLLVAFGTGLFLVAAVHHATEAVRIDGFVGPVTAFLLDGLPAVTLAYGGRWLSGTDLAPEYKWTVLVWCVVGAGLLATVAGFSVVIRAVEGRTVTEPQFALLLAANAGGGAGFLAGYHHARTQEAVRQAERATDALAFVNGILRHDLRNDLQVVESYADLIQTEAQTDDDAVRDHARTIRNQTDGAVELIESTGAIVETLTDDPDFEPVDLAAIAAESSDRVADAYDATVTTDLPDSAPVAANEGIRSAVDNLVENAAEHNDANDPRVGVCIETDTETVSLRVSDNGPGIPDDEDVFGGRDGTAHGGGLHLVETLVESYGGGLRVEDANQQGTVFVVKLPRTDCD